MIEEIKQRLEKITTGEWASEPWLVGDEALVGYRIVAGTDEPIVIASLDAHGARDAAFIAHAPADIRALLAEIERLRHHFHSSTLQTSDYITHADNQIERLEADNKRLREALERIVEGKFTTWHDEYLIAKDALKGED